MIKPIGHYSLEHPASIYDEEALTALQLSARTAGKVNEAVRAFNDLEAETNKNLVNQNNRLTRMEEEQIPNTVRDEIDNDIESGRFDKAISDYADDLGGRVDKLLGKVTEGTTTMDAEVIDGRTNNAGVQLPNLGTAVRDNYQALAKRMDNVSVYSLDMVKQTLASQEVYSGDVEAKIDQTNYNKTWQHVDKMVTLEPGNYTLVVDSLHLPSELTQYGLQVKQDRLSNGVSEAHNILNNVMAPGAYAFTVRSGDGFTQICTLVLQLSGAVTSSMGHYYARGIHIYKGHIQGKQGLPDSFTGVDKCVRKQPGKNLFNPAEATHGYYLKANGQATQENEDYPGQCHSGYIPVEAGKVYTCTPATFNGTGGFHGFYSERSEDTFITGSEMDTDTLRETDGVITAPAGAKYFRFSYKVEDESAIMVEEGNVRTPFAPYTDLGPLEGVAERVTALEAVNQTAVKRNRADIKTVNSLGHMQTLSLNTCDFNNGETASIIINRGRSRINNGFIIQFGDGSGSFRGLTISVWGDGGSIINWNDDFDEEIDFDFANCHCITVQLTFIVKGCYITLIGACDQNDEGACEPLEYANFFENGGCRGSIGIINNDETALGQCTIIAHSGGNEYKTWCFGDSYFDYWPYWLSYSLRDDGRGVTNTLFDSYSGRGSNDAVKSLQKRLAKATPERIVWCMGMNDSDSNWASSFQTVRELCEVNNIEMIVCTIPNVPDRNHNQKNTIIRNSGLRYIDLASYLSQYHDQTWLGGDNVHPTELGAKLIGDYILAHVPELVEEVL